MRYLIELDSNGAAQSPAFAARSAAVVRYASVANVIRFGLARDCFAPGQYRITEWPDGTIKPRRRKYASAYKRAR